MDTFRLRRNQVFSALSSDQLGFWEKPVNRQEALQTERKQRFIEQQLGKLEQQLSSLRWVTAENGQTGENENRAEVSRTKSKVDELIWWNLIEVSSRSGTKKLEGRRTWEEVDCRLLYSLWNQCIIVTVSVLNLLLHVWSAGNKVGCEKRP